jgi:DNA-binding HxlR family transcriptional regulator
LARVPRIKRYSHYCPAARTLDVVGERWTLLVIRSLLMGPLRYTDIRGELPGIASDLLTLRLRTLEDAGYIVRREVPRPTPATVYELTDAGRRLGPVVISLSTLGLSRLGAPRSDDEVTADGVVLLLRASFHEASADATHQGSYDLRLDGADFTVEIDDNRVDTRRGSAVDARCTLTTTARVLAEILSGAVSAHDAVDDGRVELTGPTDELDRFVETFCFAPVPAAAGA